MDAIAQWFAGDKDYHQGVALYAAMPHKKTHVLKTLNRGKTSRNMSLLVSLLRTAKNIPAPEPEPLVVVNRPKNPDQAQINQELNRQQIAQESARREFTGVRLGDLPAELRPRYQEAHAIFFAMIELKFALNDLPDNANEDALNIIKQLMELDEKRDLIWKELNHWKLHRTLLPVPEDPFEKMTPIQIVQAKTNLKSNISKLKKRIDKKYEELEAVSNGHDRLMIESSIRKSEKTLHGHQVNFNRINEMICKTK
ncbi:hypothetical protein SAMN05192545_2893 [Maribacter dokdonensis]|uniref:Uncharacterized protein n=1 Tax=Maribacter dokdonensis TaxID=320912 RepID=A0ABY0UTE9_9FLAO|nr:hypothetical protein [Maribacter dokdonensis]SDT15525.1 hypothetical protein SAMN05192545_2893 [Maribacter dokdonensis]